VREIFMQINREVPNFFETGQKFPALPMTILLRFIVAGNIILP